MKITVDTHGFKKNYNDFETFKMIKDAGFDGIDYSFFGDVNHWLLKDNYIERANKLRKSLDELQLSCEQAHAPFGADDMPGGFLYGDEMSENSPAYLEIVRSIEAASIMGVKYLVLHGITVPNNVDLEEYNLKFYKSFIPYCEKYDVKIAVENLFTYDKKCKVYRGKFGTPKSLDNFLKKLNSDCFVICIDIGHAALTGVEPQIFIDNTSSQLLKVLHIQDTDYIADRHYLPFIGELDWEAIILALKNKKYCGNINFELPIMLEKMPPALTKSALEFSVSVGKYLIEMFNN